jgi:glycosyltransferase involved in cell wall biosynthesis
MTKLSIVIAAYNVENYISSALSSIIGQTEKQYELIVIDDGSTDGTHKIIKQILQDSNEVDYKIITKENGGVSSARNKGLTDASGEYVMFLDGDDYIAENLVEEVYGLLNCSAPDVVCWGYDTVREDQTDLRNYFDHYEHISNVMSGIDALKNMLMNGTMWISTGSAAFRRDFLEKHRLKYEEGCSSGEDQEFVIKVLSRAESVIFIDKPLCFYVKREGSITNSRNINRFDVIDALVRAREYLNNIHDKDLGRITEIIGARVMVENYFNNLDSFLNSANRYLLLQQINEKYPVLNQEVLKAMKAYNGSSISFKIKCALYLISPNLYFGIVLLKRRIKCF